MLLGLPLGLRLGLPSATAIEKIGLRLIIAVPIGFLIGNYLDKKAENENRIL
ncbi:hypothetical protein [Flavobacterium sp. ALD4]|uniref:hypothetical protein n=1 Tax=Flavobacterium sp. ALD4 TaxID=2058314 RepID=UPI0012FE92A0|nr:hypothetical protein [Flavobacterium sp. ALD4]